MSGLDRQQRAALDQHIERDQLVVDAERFEIDVDQPDPCPACEWVGLHEPECWMQLDPEPLTESETATLIRSATSRRPLLLPWGPTSSPAFALPLEVGNGWAFAKPAQYRALRSIGRVS